MQLDIPTEKKKKKKLTEFLSHTVPKTDSKCLIHLYIKPETIRKYRRNISDLRISNFLWGGAVQLKKTATI